MTKVTSILSTVSAETNVNVAKVKSRSGGKAKAGSR